MSYGCKPLCDSAKFIYDPLSDRMECPECGLQYSKEDGVNMSKKPLLIVETDPEFISLKESLDSGYKMYEESKEFLQEASREKLE